LSLITLLTDFGTADGYVGEVKGVIATLAPGVPILDVSHQLAAQDVEAARLALARYWRRFPRGTVHMVVVDPGVGTSRAALAVQSEDRYLVGPDNGCLSPAILLNGSRAVELRIPGGAAPTFHGRDVFAPAAAHLAAGAALDSLGAPCTNPLIRRTPEARKRSDGIVEGEVITIDRFGNLITNLIAPRGGAVRIRGRDIGPVRRTYGEVPEGAAIALLGSTGLVEIAVRNASAALLLGVDRGERVLLTPGARS
jgi:S-adenosyl-L-methionine hydrolase (adenosine-forming)